MTNNSSCANGTGPTGAKIALVGDFPSSTDLVGGIPFIGAMGNLLGEMLSKAGIPRPLIEVRHQPTGQQMAGGYSTYNSVGSRIYITNILKNESFAGLQADEGFARKYYLHPAKAGRPTPEMQKKLAELAIELQSMPNLNVIVAAGEYALQALTGKFGITKWRGSILESTLLPGKKVIPTIHPRKVMKDLTWKVLVILDLKRAKEQAGFAEIRRPITNFTIAPSLRQVVEYANDVLLRSEKIAFDIETRGDHIACIGFAPNITDAICIPLTKGKGHYWPSAEEEMIAWKTIAEILASPVRKIAQNAPFDMSYMTWHGCPVNNIWWDTMSAQNILYPELAKDLAIMVSIYTEHPYYKDKGRAALRLKSEKAWAEGQSDTDLWVYNCTDCIGTVGVQEGQQRDFESLRVI